MAVITELLQPLTPKQREFVLLYALSGDERSSRALASVDVDVTWWRWKKDEQFRAVMTTVESGAVSRQDAIVELMGKALPKVISDILELALKDWGDVARGQEKLKVWAMGGVLDWAGERRRVGDSPRTVNFNLVMGALRSRIVGGEVVRAEHKELPSPQAG